MFQNKWKTHVMLIMIIFYCKTDIEYLQKCVKSIWINYTHALCTARTVRFTSLLIAQTANAEAFDNNIFKFFKTYDQNFKIVINYTTKKFWAKNDMSQQPQESDPCT